VLVEERPGMRWMVVMMIFPAIVLHARRLRGMGRSAWLLLAPAAFGIAALAVWLRFASLGGALDTAVIWIGVVSYLALVAWSLGGSDGNRAVATASQPASRVT